MKQILFILLSIFLSAAVRAELVIEITSGVNNPTPIAIAPMGWSGGPLAEDISRIVSDDLRRSGQLRPIPRSDMLSSPSRESEVYYRDWRALEAAFLVIGNLTKSANGDFRLEFEMFDVFAQRKIMNLAVDGSPDQLRDIAHFVSDKVYEKVTGIRGIFSTQLVYIEEVSQSQYRLMLSDADGARPRLLLETSQPLVSPTWSPNGQWIAYVSWESGRTAIFIQHVFSGERRQITNFKGINAAPAWSPDGQKLAISLSKDGNPEIYTIDVETKALKRITRHLAIDTEPSWTTDGKAIIFTSNRGAKPQIYQVTLASGRVERLTFAGDYNAAPTVSPDGKSFVFIHRDNGLDYIASQNIRSGEIRTLTREARRQLDESPSIAANGAMIMYATKDKRGRGILAAVSMDALTRFDLSTRGDVREPAWSPFID